MHLSPSEEQQNPHLAGLYADNSRVLVAFLLLLLFIVDALKLCLSKKERWVKVIEITPRLKEET